MEIVINISLLREWHSARAIYSADELSLIYIKSLQVLLKRLVVDQASLMIRRTTAVEL